MTDTNKKSEQSFEEVLKTLSSLKTQVTGLVNQTKSLEKSVKKQVKSLEKEAKKNRMKGNRKASGFAVPKPVSPELCFLEDTDTCLLYLQIKSKRFRMTNNLESFAPRTNLTRSAAAASRGRGAAPPRPSC